MPPGTAKRIVIVDDSAAMRTLLRSVFRSAGDYEIAGTATDGESAVRLIEEIRPDLILLDVEMPVMDGLDTLRKLRSRGHRMPIIMCSSLTQRGARVTIEALANGASDYVAKPAGQSGPAAAIEALARELLPKIAALTALEPTLPASILAPRPSTPECSRSIRNQVSGAPAVVLIGVSTGGPAALDVVLPALPGSFELPVLVVQHMPELFTRLLAERLAQRCALRVAEAREGDPVRSGQILIARGNWHLEVVPGSRPSQQATVHLTQAPLEKHCRPAADVLFRTGANVYGPAALAVVLTGMGSDGLEGARQIRAKGGTVIVQDQASSAIWGMPGAIAHAGLAQRVLPIHEVAPELIRLARMPRSRSDFQAVVA